MKKTVLYFVVAAFCLSMFSCSNNHPFFDFPDGMPGSRTSIESEFCEINNVPEWIKSYVNDEEYEIWQTLSSRYQVDYSFLRSYLSEQRKEEIYRVAGKLSTLIKNGQAGDEISGLFIVGIEEEMESRIQRLSNPEQGGEETRAKSSKIYEARGHHHISINVSVGYIYNTGTKKVTNLTSSTWISSGAATGLQEKFEGSTSVAWNESTGMIGGTCSGTISWIMSPNGPRQEETFTQNFTFVP